MLEEAVYTAGQKGAMEKKLAIVGGQLSGGLRQNRAPELGVQVTRNKGPELSRRAFEDRPN